MKYLQGITVVNLAVNLPGPAAARRLGQLGAKIIKVEPPLRDPMSHYQLEWYEMMCKGQEVLHLNLKEPDQFAELDALLAEADLLITANRPAALQRLGLGWETVHEKYPNLCYIAIVGYPPPNENEPGHDLTYQAKNGLLIPPYLPRTLLADMVGAEQAASQALALLLQKERRGEAGYAMVALSDAAEYMAEPLRVGFTREGMIAGGGLAEYNLYESKDGWIAVAALEPHFKVSLENALAIDLANTEKLLSEFKSKSSKEWENWAKSRDLPMVEVI